jgi:hypothetical protein
MRRRRTKIVLAPLLASIASIAVVAACSTPDQRPNTTATSGAPSTSTTHTSTTSAGAAPTPSADTPSSSMRPSAPTTAASSPPGRVRVVTTFAGWNAKSGAVEVGGYAIVVEPVGRCTLRLIRGKQVVTRQHAASADATTVACGGFSVPGTALTAGQWQAVLAYSSPRSTGSAMAVTVKVP